jgi:hypothetical protein
MYTTVYIHLAIPPPPQCYPIVVNVETSWTAADIPDIVSYGGLKEPAHYKYGFYEKKEHVTIASSRACHLLTARGKGRLRLSSHVSHSAQYSSGSQFPPTWHGP